MSLFLQKIPPRILLHLAEQKTPVTINEISFGMKIAQSQVSNTIEKFESQELVSSIFSGTSKYVKLTDKGKNAASYTKALMSVVAV